MDIQLILVRHGIAEEESGEKPDFDRALTEKGKKKLYKTLPALTNLIRHEKCMIWSSPKVRAKETAEILGETLGYDDITLHESIANGNFTTFWEELNQITHEAFTLFIVGHEPYLGMWSEEVAGLNLPFRKGAAAGFLMTGESAEDIDLEWFLQPAAMKNVQERKKRYLQK